MIRLLCLDVDGTLVGSSGQVPEPVWPLAERLRQAGVRLAIASGRPAFGAARGYAERLDPDGWHVFQSGASLVHVGTLESRSAPLPASSVTQLIDQARASAQILELYGDLEYAVESTERRAREHATLLGVPFTARAFESLHTPVVRAQWVLEHAARAGIEARLPAGLDASSAGSPVMPDTTFLSLTKHGVGKASAVRTLASLYGFEPAELMFVGDGHNDVEAMGVVGHPVAMGNAEPEAKAKAKHVVGHVDHGGLCEALELALALNAAG